MLLGQYATQIAEYDGMNREQRRSDRGKDLASRIVGLRAGLQKWMTRAAELENAIAFEVGPQRVQLSRLKGYRKPENTVVVARPSSWGNPFRVGENALTRADAVAQFRDLVMDPGAAYTGFRAQVREQLAGKNLACWCPLGDPCHADVLLEIANGVEP
ncbi:DUF4326 domain-containing protein [Microbacterium galbinum]|uniref:DUF4326 domain-containing protein n=1 Tax=Microbacterium galbinum TaxID=2851646 RepID=UPI001FFCCA0A|nr:DUF4326 domain-containing protein [Microbacterium galbinum]